MRRRDQIEVGSKIREIRKNAGLSIKKLAEACGISYLTMQKIETGKISPSVALLSEIAYQLNYPISSFVADEPSIVLVKGDEQRIIESDKMNLRILAPKGTFDENVSVALGSAKKGEFVGKHRNEGFEMSYVIRGKSIFRFGSQKYEMKEGDLVYHSGKEMHSVTALEEPFEFLNIHFLKK